MYNSLIKQVRTVDPDKIVLIEPTYGDTPVAGALADFSNLSVKTNVVWSVHDYFAGGEDDGYRADGAQAGSWTWSGGGYLTPTSSSLTTTSSSASRRRGSPGSPCGSASTGSRTGRRTHDQWIRDKTAVFNKYGLGRSWWEYYTIGGLSATTSTFAWKPWSA
jgi:hypothetical protein